jgi:hypothetical protein
LRDGQADLARNREGVAGSDLLEALASVETAAAGTEKDFV